VQTHSLSSKVFLAQLKPQTFLIETSFFFDLRPSSFLPPDLSFDYIFLFTATSFSPGFFTLFSLNSLSSLVTFCFTRSSSRKVIKHFSVVKKNYKAVLKLLVINSGVY
jgi:hypothetical protein